MVTLTFKNLVPTNIFTVTENESGVFLPGKQNVNFQINNSETIDRKRKR